MYLKNGKINNINIQNKLETNLQKLYIKHLKVKYQIKRIIMIQIYNLKVDKLFLCIWYNMTLIHQNNGKIGQICKIKMDSQ